MKKSFQKSLIAASVGAVMFAAAGTASANSLLFPYFTTASGAQSVLSISSNASANGLPGGAAATRETLRYVYNYSPLGAAPTAANTCVNLSGNGLVTANDVMQHSIAGPTAGGFGKAVGSDGSTPFYLPLGNQSGFLTVTNKSSVDGRIAGDMAIVDPATGLVVSYAGIDNGLATGGAANAANEGNFAFIQDKTFDLSVYPTSLVNTVFQTLVVGNMNAASRDGRNWTGAMRISNGGIAYDNDENPAGGMAAKRINCLGAFTTADLQTAFQATALGGNGGLIHATATAIDAGTLADNSTTPPTPAVNAADQATGLVVFKVQTVQASVGQPFAGKTFAHRMNPTGASIATTSPTVVTTTTP